jgi:predicted DNA-binding helix-hairpin-helix protein
VFPLTGLACVSRIIMTRSRTRVEIENIVRVGMLDADSVRLPASRTGTP